MKYWKNDDLKGSRLPGIGAWALCASLPVTLAVTTVLALVLSGGPWGRLLTLTEQISGSRSELLPILSGYQLGVSALVVAVAQFQPRCWRATPKKLGKRWVGEMRRVSSMESRYFVTSLGLVGISGTIVLGVAICVLRDVNAGGVLLLVIAWGVHAVSSVVLILVPTTGVAAVGDYWMSLARLFCIAECWPEGLREARSELEVGRPSLICRLRRWRIVVALLLLGSILFMVAFVEKYCSGAHSGLRRQCIAGCVAVLAMLASIAAGYWRWRGGITFSVLLFWLSVPLVLAQGLLVEVESIAVATSSSLWRNIGFGSAVTVTLVFLVLLLVVASGSRSVWGRFDCFKSTLVSVWVNELRFRRQYGNKCSPSERKAIERSFVKLAKKRKKGLAKSVKESVLLPFVSK